MMNRMRMMAPMKYHRKRRQTMNLHVFHGEVNHRNEVSGRLQPNTQSNNAFVSFLRCDINSQTYIHTGSILRKKLHLMRRLFESNKSDLLDGVVKTNSEGLCTNTNSVDVHFEAKHSSCSLHVTLSCRLFEP